MAGREWVYRDNLICICNYINRCRREEVDLQYMTMEEVRRVVSHYAKINKITIEEAAEQVKISARGEGERTLLKYIRKAVKGWKACKSKKRNV